MAKKLLLTSFDIWKAHHITNASDDLLAESLNRGLLPETTDYLRKLPVDFQQAPAQVISCIQKLQPEIVVCCGMAEQRERLTVEANGQHGGEVLQTTVNVTALVQNLAVTEVSHDAGKFVCNFLYYSVLKYLREHQLESQCLFVHVPVLHEANLEPVLADFLAVLHRVCDEKVLVKSV